jgi:hypothetical protein
LAAVELDVPRNDEGKESTNFFLKNRTRKGGIKGHFRGHMSCVDINKGIKGGGGDLHKIGLRGRKKAWNGLILV